MPIVDTIYLSSFTADQPVNSYSILAIPAMWSATRYISETTASLPAHVRGPDDNIVDGHPVNRLLNLQSASGIKSYTARQVWAAHCATTGNGYMRKIRDESGQLVGYRNLNPHCVKPFLTDDGELFYKVRTKKNGTEDIEADDILHIHLMSFDGLQGIDPAVQLAGTFELAMLADTYTRTYLRKGGAIRGYLKFPAGTPDDQVEDAKKHWTGFGNTTDQVGRTPVTSGGEYVPIGASNVDTQLAELRRQIVTDIAAIERIPPASLYQFEKYISTGEQQAADLINGLRNWIEQQEREFTAKLLTTAEIDAGYTIQIDTDSLTRIPTTAATAAVPSENDDEQNN